MPPPSAASDPISFLRRCAAVLAEHGSEDDGLRFAEAVEMFFDPKNDRDLGVESKHVVQL